MPKVKRQPGGEQEHQQAELHAVQHLEQQVFHVIPSAAKRSEGPFRCVKDPSLRSAMTAALPRRCHFIGHFS